MRHNIFSFAAVSAYALVCVAQPVSAQTPLYTSPPPPWINGEANAGQIAPYEVLRDRRITFRLKAPEAQGVKVSVGNAHADLHTYPMTRDDKGIWSTTIGPVDPEIYPYSFQLAGASVNRGSVEVKGTTPALYDAQDVPHGTFTSITYFSTVLNKRRELTVYAPPQYYSEPNRKFPVLYYYNDTGNDAGGRQPEVMDNLVAQKKAVPMLVVNLNDVANTLYRNDTEAGRVKDGEELLGDIIPLIEGRYRSLSNRENRAIGGVSHNAGATWTVSMLNLDKFGYIGMISSGMFGGLLPDPTPGGFALYSPWEPDKVLPAVSKKLLDPTTKPKLFYIACGDIDPRVNPTRKAVEQMATYGVKPVFEVYPGGHQGKATRPAYISFVSRLFKKQ
jgi:enterochelin esterase family protein